LQHIIRLPEANIQAEFYHHARLLGFVAILELSTPAGRHDIAILNHEQTHLLAIVECKSNESRRVYHSPQIRRYKQLGVPVFGLADFDRAEHLAAQIHRQFIASPSPGISLDDIFAMPKIKRRLSKAERILRRVDECLNFRA
jgi:hypothetical protein